MQAIDRELIDRVLEEARQSPRQRKNFNFHDRDTHPCQRLINAILPQSYIRPHRHLDPDKEEMLVMLCGRLGLVFFDDAGNVVDTVLLEAGGERLAAGIPPGRFHTVVALDEPAVVFETKAGPYAPHAPEEQGEFAPGETAPEAACYLKDLKKRFDAV
ncbi:MAG TPA: WbuC family cupin fold metalloprotein [Burkholderiales bacterium]|nr:WbuC family cupin fold metalloprotein [Burkholderiales bacterium]